MAHDDYSALFEEDEVGFYFDIRKASNTDVFQIGQGYANPKSSVQNLRATTARLRFGLGGLVDPPQKKAKPAQPAHPGPAPGNQSLQKQQHRAVHLFGEVASGENSSASAAASSSSRVPAAQTEDRDGDQDLYPLHLSREASAEFRTAAMSADMAAADQLSSEPLDDPKERPGKTFFHTKLGILGIGHVKRAGVKCYHCFSLIEKSDLRFEFAHDKRKPPRAIHTGCLVQMNDEERKHSVKTLAGLLLSDLPAQERSCCAEAVAVLRSLG